MRGSDYFLIGLTFLTGIFAGVYVYVTGFAPDYVYKPLTKTEDIAFALDGQMYGGCERALKRCARFSLQDSRAYNYDPAQMRNTKPPKVIEGVLDRKAFNSLLEEVKQTQLNSFTTVANSCASASDGSDYRYRLVYQGQEYFFDTCGSTFGDSRLAAVFSGLWLEVATSTNWVDSVSGFRPAEFMGDWLNKRLRTGGN